VPTSPSTDILISVTRRLFIALIVLFAAALAISAVVPSSRFVVPSVVIATGLIGGFVGLQRRLKDLTLPDLELIAGSWIYTCLSPMVGGILAQLLYILFLSELLSGQLFPHFVLDIPGSANTRFSSIFYQHAEHYQDYAKLVFWSFIAGYSERFVTDVISRFEGAAIKQLPGSSSIVNIKDVNTSKIGGDVPHAG
jgi:hypothetical protein